MNIHNKVENERRIDQLENLVKKETRTERHLEQNADIPRSPEVAEHINKIQQERQNEISNLKNIIVNGVHSNNDQLKNTEKRYNYTEGYLNHNADHMSKKSLESTLEKQKSRREQIDQLK